MYQIITYNTNQPERCTEIVSSGTTVSVASMIKIKDDCGDGPYFGFDEKEPFKIFRFRGPFQGVKPFFILDSTGINSDNDFLKTHERVMSIIKEKRKSTTGVNK